MNRRRKFSASVVLFDIPKKILCVGKWFSWNRTTRYCIVQNDDRKIIGKNAEVTEEGWYVTIGE